MSKKIMSILLTAALLVAALCVGTVSASAEGGTATYYFLAPDSYFATNDQVGYYYWAPEENAAWPGLPMTPAPEVGKNVFKCTAPDMDSTSTIIFNAFVDAGTPADPELAAVAHQTVNINTEGYMTGESELYDSLGMELENFDNMIYVLDFDSVSVNDFSGATTTGGEWFSINPEDVHYYRNFDAYYGRYEIADDTQPETMDEPVVEPSTDTTSEEPTSSKDDDKTPSSQPSSSSKNENSSNTSSKASPDTASSKTTSTTTASTASGTVQTAGTFTVISLVVILMAAGAIVLYTKKKAQD